MANKKISDLTALIGADSATDDVFVVVDTSAEAGEGETKRITRAELIEAVAQNFVTVTASGTITAGGLVVAYAENTDGFLIKDINDTSRWSFRHVKTGTDSLTIRSMFTSADVITFDEDGNVSIPSDSAKLKLGVGSDLQLYHDGVNSYIKNTTGQIFINKDGPSNAWVCGSEAGFVNPDDTEYLIRATSNGPVKLYHNGSEKLATTASGVDVTGTVTADGLTVSGGGGAATGYLGEVTNVSGAAGSRDGFKAETYLTNSTTKILTAASNGTDRFVVTGDGNVSIKTNNKGLKGKETGSTERGLAKVNASNYCEFGDAGVNGVEYRSGVFHSWKVGSSEKMRIDVSGNVLVGTTDSGLSLAGVKTLPAGKIRVVNASGAMLETRHLTTNGTIASFLNTGGNTVGSISQNGSTTSYNEGSDYRLKEDIQPMTGASERVLALNPVNFAWKVDGSRVDGFLAHEAQEVVPNAVTGAKDAMRDEEYEVTPVLGEVFTPAIAGIDEVTETVVVTQAIAAQDAVMGEFQVTETVETGTYVNLAGVTITETREVGVTEEATETVVERQDIDGISTEVEVERTVQVAVMEAYEVSPAIEAVAEVTEVNVITKGIEAIAEVILETDVERPTELADQQQWRETAEQVMDTRSVPDMQGIDQSKIVPLLVAALQEALARIESLEA